MTSLVTSSERRSIAMSGGYRNDRPALLALALILLTLCFIAFFEVASRNANSIKSEEPRNSNSQSAQEPNGVGTEAVSDFEPWHEGYAQWLMAFFAIVSTAISGVGIFYLANTLQRTAEATEAANEANRLTRLEHRPWMDFELLSVDSLVISAKKHSVVKLRIENVGKSIAHNGRVFCSFYEGGTKEHDELRPQLIKQALEWPHPGFTALIDRPFGMSELVFFPRTIADRPLGELLGSINLCIVVKYSDAISAEQFYTAKNYLLWQVGGRRLVFMAVGEAYAEGMIVPSLDSNRTTFK